MDVVSTSSPSPSPPSLPSSSPPAPVPPLSPLLLLLLLLLPLLLLLLRLRLLLWPLLLLLLLLLLPPVKWELFGSITISVLTHVASARLGCSVLGCCSAATAASFPFPFTLLFAFFGVCSTGTVLSSMSVIFTRYFALSWM
jgi:hypothetical protein